MTLSIKTAKIVAESMEDEVFVESIVIPINFRRFICSGRQRAALKGTPSDKGRGQKVYA